MLGEHRWDITALRGAQATIAIIDQATEPWGHLLVDEIQQLDLSACR